MGFLARFYVYLRHEEREGDDHEGGVPGEEVRPRRGQVHHPPSQAQAQYVHNHSSLSLLQALLTQKLHFSRQLRFRITNYGSSSEFGVSMVDSVWLDFSLYSLKLLKLHSMSSQ